MKNTFNNKRVRVFLLIFFCLVSLTLHIYKGHELCLNEDEAAQGYNTYSVLETGRDEYGQIPIRYLSFGENKLPLTGFLSTPFIALFGLNELSVRLPIYIIGVLFPIIFYLATLSLTKRHSISLVSAFLSSGNIWLQTTSRHQHESVVLSAIVLIYIAILFWKDTPSKLRSLSLSLLLFLGMYSYHSAKIIMPSLALFTLFYLIKNSNQKSPLRFQEFIFNTIILATGILAFVITEVAFPNNRLGNLSYFTNPIFVHEIEEGRRLGGSPIFYNKLTYGTYKLTQRSIQYLSPEYLLIQSDPNPRYGARYLPLLTTVEYLSFISGLIFCLYFLITKRNAVSNIFLCFLTVVTILPASLALPTLSSTRSYTLLIPLLMIASIGILQFFLILRKVIRYKVFLYITFILLIFFHTYSLATNWQTYFDKYLSDLNTKKAWQCGMREVSKLAWQKYDDYNKIYISSALGQPYIFLLFYGSPYPPKKYQKVAKRMPYNEYGFWEQDSFDKFVFVDEKPRALNKGEIFLSP